MSAAAAEILTTRPTAMSLTDAAATRTAIQDLVVGIHACVENCRPTTAQTRPPTTKATRESTQMIEGARP